MKYSLVSSIANVNTANTYYVGGTSNPLSIYIYSTVNPNTVLVRATARQYGIYVTAKHLLILNNVDCRYAAYAGIRLNGPQPYSYCTVDSCNLYANRQDGVYIYNGSNNNIVTNCTASYNGNGFYSDEADRNIFRNNISNNNIRYTLGVLTDGNGIGVYASSFVTVEYNTTYDNTTGCGIEVDLAGLDSAIVVRYNASYGNGSVSEGYGIKAGNLAGLETSNLIYYNLVYLNGNDPIDKMGREIYTHNGNISILNNTIYTTGISLAYGITIDESGYVTVKNNIIYAYGGNNRRCLRRLSTAVLTTNNNDFYSTAKNPFFDGATAYDFSSWLGLGYDLNSTLNNPLFSNASSGDFSLQAGSPCINAGVNVGLTSDYLNHPIIGLPDLGAFEKQ